MTPLPSTVRAAAAAATLACLAALAAGCGSGSPAAAPTVTVTATPGGANSGAPATSPPEPTPSSNEPPPCPTSGLRVTQGLGQGTAGKIYTVIDFTNAGGAPCTLFGYPGVSFVTAPGGTQVGPAAVENSQTARQLVVLKPGETANALLQIVDTGNFPAAKCQPVTAHALKIYPPNQTAPVYLSYTAQTCAKKVQILTINSVRAGSGGSA